MMIIHYMNRKNHNLNSQNEIFCRSCHLDSIQEVLLPKLAEVSLNRSRGCRYPRFLSRLPIPKTP